MLSFALIIAIGLIAFLSMGVTNSPPNPATVMKRRVVDTYAAEAVAAGTFTGSAIEVPRGARRISFGIEGVTADRTTGDETYDLKIQTSFDGGTTWVDVNGLAFTQIATATPTVTNVPSAANAPGVTLGRKVRAHLTSAGTSPILTATIAMYYEATGEGGGKQHDPAYYGG